MATDDAPGPRIEAAKQAASALMGALPDGTETALVTYGTETDDRPESQVRSCRDISVLRELAPLEQGNSERVGGQYSDEIGRAINELDPGGYTPIGRALNVAVEELDRSEVGGERAIVLISDGEDTCGDPAPCEAARAIAQAHPDVTISTIGFKSDVEELACVARETGGLYLTADDVDQLVTRVVAAQNAPAGATALTTTGRSGVELGQHFDEISAAHPEFPSQGEGTNEGELTVIRWIDCDWVFGPDGYLVEIRQSTGSTVDGLAVGHEVGRARALYGEPLETDTGNDGRFVEVFPASREAGTAWKIAYDSDNVIRSITLCACLPGAGGASSRFRGLPEGVPGWARGPGAPEVEVLRPVSSDGAVQDGWDVVGGSSGFQCESTGVGPRPSFSAVEAGTVECSTVTAHAARNCWPDETGRNALCLRSVFERTLASVPSPYQLSGLPPVDEPGVVAVELANGERCTYVSGGAGSYIREGSDVFNSRFACGRGALFSSNDGPGTITSGRFQVVPGGFYVDGSGFTAKYSTDFETLSNVDVTAIYFLGTA